VVFAIVKVARLLYIELDVGKVNKRLHEKEPYCFMEKILKVQLALSSKYALLVMKLEAFTRVTCL
jgi:hypothetical protein